MGSVHGSWLFIGSEKNVHEFAVHGRNSIEKPFPHLRLRRQKKFPNCQLFVNSQFSHLYSATFGNSNRLGKVRFGFKVYLALNQIDVHGYREKPETGSSFPS